MIKILLPVLAASFIYAGDYEDAKRYLNGELGVKIITKRMPNCPYEKCDEVADRDGAVADFDIGDRKFSGVDTIYPVLHVPACLPECETIAPFSFFFHDVEFLFQLFGDLRRVRAELVAIDFEFPFFADKDGASHGAFSGFDDEFDLNAIGILHSDFGIRSFREK